MKVGVAVGNFGTFGKHGGALEQIDVAVRAELLGFDSIWLHDHLFMPAAIGSRYPYNDSGIAGFAYRQDIYDPLAMMAAIAVRTERIELGTGAEAPERSRRLRQQSLVRLEPHKKPSHLVRHVAGVGLRVDGVDLEGKRETGRGMVNDSAVLGSGLDQRSVSNPNHRNAADAVERSETCHQAHRQFGRHRDEEPSVVGGHRGGCGLRDGCRCRDQRDERDG